MDNIDESLSLFNQHLNISEKYLDIHISSKLCICLISSSRSFHKFRLPQEKTGENSGAHA